jgi:hypothetical protein
VAPPEQSADGQGHQQEQDRLGHSVHHGPPATAAAQLGQGHFTAAGLDRIADRQEQQQQAGHQQLRHGGHRTRQDQQRGMITSRRHQRGGGGSGSRAGNRRRSPLSCSNPATP